MEQSKSLGGERYHVPGVINGSLDMTRWGAFINIASTWGSRPDYYYEGYKTWPQGSISCNELWEVVRWLNAKLFRAALDEVNLAADVGERNLASSLQSAKNMPLEPEILPAKVIIPNAPDVLVQTDELVSHILLSGSSAIVKQRGTSRVQKSATFTIIGFMHPYMTVR